MANIDRQSKDKIKFFLPMLKFTTDQHSNDFQSWQRRMVTNVAIENRLITIVSDSFDAGNVQRILSVFNKKPHSDENDELDDKYS